MAEPPVQAAASTISTGAAKGAEAFPTNDQPSVQDKLNSAVIQTTRFQVFRSAYRPQNQLPAIAAIPDTTPTPVINVWLSPRIRTS